MSAHRCRALCLLVSFLFMFQPSFAANTENPELSASLGFLPKVLESPDKGSFVDLVKALDKEYPGTIKINVYPIPRSIANIIEGKSDFQMPWIKNKLIPEDKLPFRYLSEKLGDVYFVIYSRKDNPVTPKEIAAALKTQQKSGKKFPYKIETYNGIAEYFDFPTTPANQIEASLKKIEAKRIDAAIFAQEESDHVIQELKMKKLHRAEYERFDDVIVIQKGPAGDKVEAALSTAIKKLKADGTWQALFARCHGPFKAWQP